MKKYILGAALLLSANLSAKTFTTPDSNVRFNLPDNYTALSASEIALKFPAPRVKAPEFMIGNEPRSISLAYGHNELPLTEENMTQSVKYLHSAFSASIPNIRWVEHKIMPLSGKNWVYLEFISKARGTDTHNIMILTPHKGKSVAINLNATVEAFQQNEAALRQAINTIELP